MAPRPDTHMGKIVSRTDASKDKHRHASGKYSVGTTVREPLCSISQGACSACRKASGCGHAISGILAFWHSRCGRGICLSITVRECAAFDTEDDFFIANKKNNASGLVADTPDVHVIADVAASDSPSWRLHRAFTYNMDSARPMDTDDTNFLVRRPVEDLGESPLICCGT